MGTPSGPPPPPAPPVYYSPPYGGQMTPVGPPIGAMPPTYQYGPPARELIRKIADGVRWYLITLVLNLIAAVGSAALTGYVISSAFGVGGTSLPNSGVAASAAGLGLLLGLLALLSFIFTIVAWVTWRSGIRTLPTVAMEYGPEYAKASQGALRDYGRTVWAFLSIIIATVVFVIVIVAYVVSQVFGSCGPLRANNTTCVNSAVTNLAGVVLIALVFGLVVALLNFLEYFFASRSLVDSLRVLVPAAQQMRLDRGRLLMVIGAGVTPLGLINAGLIIANHSVPALAFIGILTPLFLVLGIYLIHGVYREWLTRPPQVAGPPGGYGSSPPPAAAPYGSPPPAYAPPR